MCYDIISNMYIIMQPIWLYCCLYVWPDTEKKHIKVVNWLSLAQKLHIFHTWCTLIAKFYTNNEDAHRNIAERFKKVVKCLYFTQQISLACVLGVIGWMGIFLYSKSSEIDNSFLRLAFTFTLVFVNVTGLVLILVPLILGVLVFTLAYFFLIKVGYIERPADFNGTNFATGSIAQAIHALSGTLHDKLNKKDLTQQELHVKKLDDFQFSEFTNLSITTCPICYEDYGVGSEVLIQPKCHHSFCKNCVFEWFKKNASCPSCRATIKPQIGMKPLGVDQLGFKTETNNTDDVKASQEMDSGDPLPIAINPGFVQVNA